MSRDHASVGHHGVIIGRVFRLLLLGLELLSCQSLRGGGRGLTQGSARSQGTTGLHERFPFYEYKSVPVPWLRD